MTVLWVLGDDHSSWEWNAAERPIIINVRWMGADEARWMFCVKMQSNAEGLG